MDYIREAEKKLAHYKDMQRSLKYQDREISKLKWAGAPNGITGMSMDGMPKGNKADEMINIAFELKAYMDMKNATEQAILEIDTILKNISIDKGCELYERVLRLWYIECMKKEKILSELNYGSLTSIYELKNAAIRKFAVNLFGYEALKAI
jgi:hypothetical protein